MNGVNLKSSLLVHLVYFPCMCLILVLGLYLMDQPESKALGLFLFALTMSGQLSFHVSFLEWLDRRK